MTEERIEQEAITAEENQPKRHYRFWEAFKNFAIIFSFVVNFVLILVLLLSPAPLFMAKSQIAEPLLDDLDAAFAALGDTNIETTVSINHQMPVQFILPLEQDTNVVLVDSVPLNVPATFELPGWGGSINGNVRLELPISMTLPVALDLDVPVDAMVPVEMEVPVVIQLNEAGMGPAITQLRGVFSPINTTLQSLPDSTGELFTSND